MQMMVKTILSISLAVSASFAMANKFPGLDRAPRDPVRMPTYSAGTGWTGDASHQYTGNLVSPPQSSVSVNMGTLPTAQPDLNLVHTSCSNNGKYNAGCTAVCPAGTRILTGSCATGNANWGVFQNWASGNGWYCYASRISGTGDNWIGMSAHAYCY